MNISVSPTSYPGQTGWSEAETPFCRGNSKLQISNAKQITMTEIQNPKREYDLEERTFQLFWSLNIVI